MSNARHYPQDICLYKDIGAYQDGFCHDELNTAECNYDGGDCCSSVVYTNVCNQCQCHDSSIKGNFNNFVFRTRALLRGRTSYYLYTYM